MRGPLLALSLVAALLVVSTGVIHAQPAPNDLPWERWFAALNAGDVRGAVALMRTEVDEGGVLVPRCAGGCLGMDAIEVSVAAMIADGYQGIIMPASVQLAGGVVSFDVAETAGTPPLATVTHWAMELDGDLIAPACEGVCLRSPTARAALVDPPAPHVAAGPVPVAAPPAPRAIDARSSPVVLAAPREGDTAAGTAGPTPVGGLLVGLVAGLLIMAASAGLDGWSYARRRPSAVRVRRDEDCRRSG